MADEEDRQDLDENGEDVEDGSSIERPGSAPPTLELNSTNLFSFGTEQTKLFSDIRFEEDYAAFYQSVGGTQEGLPPPLNPETLTRVRKESIDLFLSQSPSHALGSDFLRKKIDRNAPPRSPHMMQFIDDHRGGGLAGADHTPSPLALSAIKAEEEDEQGQDNRYPPAHMGNTFFPPNHDGPGLPSLDGPSLDAPRGPPAMDGPRHGGVSLLDGAGPGPDTPPPPAPAPGAGRGAGAAPGPRSSPPRARAPPGLQQQMQQQKLEQQVYEMQQEKEQLELDMQRLQQEQQQPPSMGVGVPRGRGRLEVEPEVSPSRHASLRITRSQSPSPRGAGAGAGAGATGVGLDGLRGLGRIPAPAPEAGFGGVMGEPLAPAAVRLDAPAAAAATAGGGADAVLGLCRFYKQGKCRSGARCKFVHTAQPQPAADALGAGGEIARVAAQPVASPAPVAPAAAMPVTRIASPPPPMGAVAGLGGVGGVGVGGLGDSGTDLGDGPLSLESVRGRIVSLSKDQNGCRLLQELISSGGPTAVGVVLQEVLMSSSSSSVAPGSGGRALGEMMVDAFGNYLFQKMVECADEGQRLEILQALDEHNTHSNSSTNTNMLVAAALNLHGTRCVQGLVELCPLPAQQLLLQRLLRPAVVQMCTDSNGNHVIQRVLLYMTQQQQQFVMDAVCQDFITVATHRHGCCVLQRCLDSANDQQQQQLLAEVVRFALRLMQDPFGNYVVQYVLLRCPPSAVQPLLRAPLQQQQLGGLCVQKFSSNVIEKCLEIASPEVRAQYVRQLISAPGPGQPNIRTMLLDQFGNYVVQKALQLSDPQHAWMLAEAVRPHLHSLRSSSSGRRIAHRILKRFPAFQLDAPNPPQQQQQQQQVPPPPPPQQQQQQQQAPLPQQGGMRAPGVGGVPRVQQQHMQMHAAKQAQQMAQMQHLHQQQMAQQQQQLQQQMQQIQQMQQQMQQQMFQLRLNGNATGPGGAGGGAPGAPGGPGGMGGPGMGGGSGRGGRGGGRGPGGAGW